MTTWNYIKGNEKDFEGAPEWALFIIHSTKGNNTYAVASVDPKTVQHIYNVSSRGGPREGWLDETSNLKKYLGCEVKIIAQRKPVTNDNINHPLRYTKGDIECIDAIKAATVGKTGIEAVDVGHVIRYLWRYEEKDGLESVKKAEWYIKHLINELEGK